MSIKKWEEFEQEAAEFLRKELYDLEIKVEHKGGADSTIPDIKITKKNNESFYIEAKVHNAQSSQFVVNIVDKQFCYSEKNKFDNNIFCQEIIDTLNDSFDIYSQVDQSGMFVPISDLLATNCIIENMKNKNVKYLITIDKNNKKRIIPINDFQYFFNAITKFRTKKSGSRNLSKKFIIDFKEKFEEAFPNQKFELITRGKKIYVMVNETLNEKQKHISSNELPGISQYYLSDKGSNYYEVRITGNTDNANIIFEINVKDDIEFDGYNIDTFIDDIN